MISEKAYAQAAQEIGCDIAIIKAVVHIESKGKGFTDNDEPQILFERHVFHNLTKGKYSKDYQSSVILHLEDMAKFLSSMAN